MTSRAYNRDSEAGACALMIQLTQMRQTLPSDLQAHTQVGQQDPGHTEHLSLQTCPPASHTGCMPAAQLLQRCSS